MIELNPGDCVTCIIMYVLQTDTTSELLQFQLVCYSMTTSLENLLQGCSRSRNHSAPATHDPLAIASFLIVHTNTVPKLMCRACWPVHPMLYRRVLTEGCFGYLAWRRSFASAPWTTASDLEWLQGNPAQDRKLVAGQSWECSAGGWRWYCTSKRHSQPSLKHLGFRRHCWQYCVSHARSAVKVHSRSAKISACVAQRMLPA